MAYSIIRKKDNAEPINRLIFPLLPMKDCRRYYLAICGELSKPNGHVYKCRGCGFQADRHLIAAWNIAAKLPMWGALPLSPKAAYETLKRLRWNG